MPEKTPEELRALAALLIEMAENITLVEVALDLLQEIDSLKLEESDKKQLKKTQSLLKVFLRNSSEEELNQIAVALKTTALYKEVIEMQSEQ
jgi:hypothetical protein